MSTDKYGKKPLNVEKGKQGFQETAKSAPERTSLVHGPRLGPSAEPPRPNPITLGHFTAAAILRDNLPGDVDSVEVSASEDGRRLVIGDLLREDGSVADYTAKGHKGMAQSCLDESSLDRNSIRHIGAQGRFYFNDERFTPERPIDPDEELARKQRRDAVRIVTQEFNEAEERLATYAKADIAGEIADNFPGVAHFSLVASESDGMVNLYTEGLYNADMTVFKGTPPGTDTTPNAHSPHTSIRQYINGMELPDSIKRSIGRPYQPYSVRDSISRGYDTALKRRIDKVRERGNRDVY